jgi:hypothetical protein
MATQSITSTAKTKRTELDTLLTSWESRYKLRLLSKNLPRAFMLGLIVSMIIGVIGYSQRLFLAQNLAVITIAITGISGLLVVLYTQVFPRPRDVSAQYFDVEFGLQERVSTALELLDGRIQTNPEIESIQISDALTHASEIDPNETIEMDFRPVELIALGVLLFAMVAMIVIPLVVGQDMPPENPSPAVQAAQEDVRDITETIATDTDLNDIDREELLEALEIALERLEEENISDEEAFAAMSQLESEISEVENELQEGIDLDQSGLEAASEALSEFTPPDEGEGNEETQGEGQPQEGLASAEDLSNAIEELSQDADNLSEEDAQNAADALNQAAQDLAQSNPELSQALQDLADALESGNSENIQQQAENAQQELQQQRDQLQQDLSAQDMLENQSDITRESAEDIAQQQSDESGDGQDPATPQEGETESSDNPSQQGGQPGNEQGENVQPGDSQGDQQPSANMQGNNDTEPNQQNDQTSGAGSGDGDSSNTSLEGGGGQDEGAETDNQATGEGISQFEAIYNPVGIEGGGANEIELESDASDQSLAEGDFEDNPLGQSRVTYDTVFSDYQDAANRALESDYVPLGLRDVVRDYFTSLEPTGGE